MGLNDPVEAAVLIGDSHRCTGCKTCEMVCSLSHDGEVVPAWARLRIEWDCFSEPNPTISLCRQCPDAPCLEACPSGAIVIDPHTGVPVVDEEECTACGICVEACEYGMIRLLPSEPERAFKCDLCGGDPVCVEHCPQVALALVARGA